MDVSLCLSRSAGYPTIVHPYSFHRNSNKNPAGFHQAGVFGMVTSGCPKNTAHRIFYTCALFCKPVSVDPYQAGGWLGLTRLSAETTGALKFVFCADNFVFHQPAIVFLAKETMEDRCRCDSDHNSNCRCKHLMLPLSCCLTGFAVTVIVSMNGC